MPRDHFHGPTFHALLHEYRAEHLAATRRKEEEAAAAAAAAERKRKEGERSRATTTDDLASDEKGSLGAVAGVGGSRAGQSGGGADGGRNRGDGEGEAEAALTTTTPVGSGIQEADTQAPPPVPPSPLPPPPPPAVVLPIDTYREEILEHVRNNRVTVIHGETGSGKSTRIPVMLVEEALDQMAAAAAEAVGADAAESAPVRRPRMFVSQPRRAATRALVQRVRQEAEISGKGWGVGLRLGHGVREGPPKAEVTFATTGYLARLLASNPGVLDSHTHLIIDEVCTPR